MPQQNSITCAFLLIFIFIFSIFESSGGCMTHAMENHKHQFSLELVRWSLQVAGYFFLVSIIKKRNENWDDDNGIKKYEDISYFRFC
jgi:hypothetical protein